MSVAIRVAHLSKRYRLGLTHAGSIRDLVARLPNPFASKSGAAALPEHRGTRSGGNSPEYCWALEDVSFEVQQGEVVGIIGRNGAGKSTLLKVLSRITTPTGGRVEIHGRVASLLEVGTGFHPELTGRENIFLNGAILGMRKSEISARFDEIVAFSEVERFIDTPVKRYSSGMYVRLAFAVAAHLESEVLIVDEVLAVGDLAFQRKCMGKMSEVAGSGKTVLFVSHNMNAIRSLCPRSLVLSDGRVISDDNTLEAAKTYVRDVSSSSQEPLSLRRDRAGSGVVRIEEVAAITGPDRETGTVGSGETVRFRFRLSSAEFSCDLRFAFYNEHGTVVCCFDTRNTATPDFRGKRGDPVINCRVENLCLAPGRYSINVAIYLHGEVVDHVEGAYVLDVTAGEWEEYGIDEQWPGDMVIPHQWIRS